MVEHALHSLCQGCGKAQAALQALALSGHAGQCSPAPRWMLTFIGRTAKAVMKCTDTREDPTAALLPVEVSTSMVMELGAVFTICRSLEPDVLWMTFGRARTSYM